jgi:hypothetical protein
MKTFYIALEQRFSNRLLRSFTGSQRGLKWATSKFQKSIGNGLQQCLLSVKKIQLDF